MPLDPEHLALLVCPESKQPLLYVPAGVPGGEALFCPASRLRYRIDDGIPILLIDEAERLDEGEAERLRKMLA
ncbi:MAG TPA: Trm112 family protein [Kofleriaceae bacterium]|nr:Trm112 family protein [Kofleriaceae bacterium]